MLTVSLLDPLAGITQLATPRSLQACLENREKMRLRKERRLFKTRSEAAKSLKQFFGLN